MSTDLSRNYDPDRIYRINLVDEACSFYPGRTKNGEQVLMGPLEDALLVAVFFSPDGRYLRYELRPVLEKPDPTKQVAERLQLGYILQRTIVQYANELQMVPCDIEIRHFAFPEWHIGIAEWPGGTFEEVRAAIARTGALPDDEFVRDWSRDKRWVLHWKKDFWMNADGEIGDT